MKKYLTNIIRGKKKKTLISLLVFVLVMTSGGVFNVTSVSAELYQGFYYITDETNSHIIITSADRGSKDLVIPEEIDGKPVKEIGDYAFLTHRLTSITIPEGVEKIGVMSFGANDFTSVELPASLKSIGMGAFTNNHLSNITIKGASTTISNYSFMAQLYDKETDDKGYYVNEKPPESITMRGYSNSTSERYANKEGYKFINLALGDEPEEGSDEGEDSGGDDISQGGEELVDMTVKSGMLLSGLSLNAGSSLYLEYANSKTLTLSGVLGVHDGRGTGEGWTSTINISPFTKSGVDDPTSSKASDKIDIRLTGVTVKIATSNLQSGGGQGLNGLTLEPVIHPTLGGEGVRVLKADTGSGMGVYSADLDITIDLGKGLAEVVSSTGSGSKLSRGSVIGLISGQYSATMSTTTGTGL